MSRRLRIVVALAAGFLLSASCAAEVAVRNGTAAYGPVLVSRIVSRPDLQFRTARGEQGGAPTTILAYQRSGQAPSPVAVMTFFRSADAAYVSIRRLPLPKSAVDRDQVTLATLEHLYTLVLRLDPEARYAFSDRDQPFESLVRNSRSHPEVLRQLAQTRQQLVGQAKRANTIVPWRVVALGPADVDNAGLDKASVRITYDNDAMDGSTVIFHRAPHSGCVAKSGADGVAVCELVDQHGDDDSHDESKVPVLATYPGEVRADVVLLPTTLMMGPKP